MQKELIKWTSTISADIFANGTPLFFFQNLQKSCRYKN